MTEKSKAHKMKINQMTVTPEFAAKLLRTNNMNRPLSKPHVNNLANAMLRGEWSMNGDAIRISKCGKLLDGQHRLSAIIKSGISCETVVISELDIETFHTIDIGRKSRGAADILAIQGEKNWNVLAGALNVICGLEFTPRNPDIRRAHSVAQIESTLAKHPKIRDFVSKSDTVRNIVSPIIFAPVYYFYSCIDSEKADSFFNGLKDGYNLPYGSPIAAVRDRLMLNKTSRARADRKELLGILIKGFNYHFENKPMHKVRFSYTEDFPMIKCVD